MKLIVDSCVWSLSLRRQNAARLSADEQQMIAELREAVQARRVVIIGPIRQEVLSGIRDQGQFARTERLLEPFLDQPVLSRDYIEAARLYNVCQDHGVQCGAIDILLCALAARLRYRILTTDGALTRCMAVLQAVGLLP